MLVKMMKTSPSQNHLPLPEAISPDAIIHPGCQIRGEKTSIGSGCEIGTEGPVVLENVQLGRNVKLSSGFFSNTIFLDGAQAGANAHTRAGTILEEQANFAHTVGLKQTILFPFVTLGSLINFCDLLMAGGTDRKNHSEVGSSYIHFNFTPHQDKATTSLLGDVARGVLLNQSPIFLGGQGGLVGPARVAYGSVVAAGSVIRTDLLKENQLYSYPPLPEITRDYKQGIYKKTDRIIKNNFIYMGNIRALKAWYQNIRTLFIRDAFDQAVIEGALRNLDLIFSERINRLEQLVEKLLHSATYLKQEKGTSVAFGEKQHAFCEAWKSELQPRLYTLPEVPPPKELLDEINRKKQEGYLTVIRALHGASQKKITTWLQRIIDQTTNMD
jgi:UDP-N-acetylglucosamine/UDP-N-acetylgalactosamine diphosphorylase